MFDSVDRRTLLLFTNDGLFKMLGIYCVDTIINNRQLQKTNQLAAEQECMEGYWRWIWHTFRSSSKSITRRTIILNPEYKSTGRIYLENRGRWRMLPHEIQYALVIKLVCT